MIKKLINKLAYISFIHDSKIIYKTYTWLYYHIIGSRFPVKIQGHLMYLDQYDSQVIFIRGIHEPLTTPIAKKLVNKGDIVIDIGANIGYYSLIFSELVGEQGRVYAFEPNSQLFSLLEKNIKINNRDNIIPVKKMVSNFNGRTRFLLEDVDVITIDEYFKDKDIRNKIKFIKIDIDGTEEKAIIGMDNVIKLNNIILLTEVFPKALEGENTNTKQYINLLKKYGLKPTYIIDENKQFITNIQSDLDILNIDNPVNMILYPK